MRNSILIKVILAISLTVLVLLIVFGLVNSFVLRRIIHQDKIEDFGNRLALLNNSLEDAHTRARELKMSDFIFQTYQGKTVEKLRDSYYQDDNQIYPFILDKKGKVIMHPELKQGSAKLKEAIDYALLIKNKEGMSEFSFQGKNYWMVYDYFSPWEWTVAFCIPLDAKYASLVSFNTFQLLFTLVFLILIALTIFLLLRNILGPLKRVSRFMRELAQGGGDLTRELMIKSRDEIGILAADFNHFIVSLRKLVVEIKSALQELETNSENLASSSEQSSAAIEEIRASIQSITKKASNLDLEVHQAGQLTAAVLEKSRSVREQSDQQADDLVQASSAAEEMNVSITSISHTMEEKIKLIENLREIAQSGNQEMENTKAIINKIAGSAQLILDTVTVINDIASHTDLLAMNAAIEAAHAGEAGKGFAVVAEEIRKLAEDSTSNARQISESLQQILDSFDKSQDSAKTTADYFQRLVTDIQDLSQSMQEMRQGLGEINSGSSQIAGITIKLKESGQTVLESTRQMEEGADSIKLNLNNLQGLSMDMKNALEEISAGLDEVNTSASVISHAGESNLQQGKNVRKLVEKFMTE